MGNYFQIKIKNFVNFATALKMGIKLIKTINMGKGDKKSRRGKIILGSYGVRRPRKKADKPGVKLAKAIKVKNPNDLKPEKTVKETQVAKEKAVEKVPKLSKEKDDKKEEKKEVKQEVKKEVKQEVKQEVKKDVKKEVKQEDKLAKAPKETKPKSKKS